MSNLNKIRRERKGNRKGNFLNQLKPRPPAGGVVFVVVVVVVLVLVLVLVVVVVLLCYYCRPLLSIIIISQHSNLTCK